MKRRRSKFTAILLAAFSMGLFAAMLASPAAAKKGGNGNGHKQFGKHDQELIQAARLKGDGSITIIIAAARNERKAMSGGGRRRSFGMSRASSVMTRIVGSQTRFCRLRKSHQIKRPRSASPKTAAKALAGSRRMLPKSMRGSLQMTGGAASAP